MDTYCEMFVGGQNLGHVDCFTCSKLCVVGGRDLGHAWLAGD